MIEKACKKCKAITKEKECPLCHSTSFTVLWRGKVIIIDPAKADIAKKLQITVPGVYALRI